MAGKTGEAALQEKLEQIRLDYLSLVEKVRSENVKAAADLEKKFLKDGEDFKAQKKELEEIVQPIIAKLYQQGGGPPPGGEGGEPEEEDFDKDEL